MTTTPNKIVTGGKERTTLQFIDLPINNLLKKTAKFYLHTWKKGEGLARQYRTKNVGRRGWGKQKQNICQVSRADKEKEDNPFFISPIEQEKRDHGIKKVEIRPIYPRTYPRGEEGKSGASADGILAEGEKLLIGLPFPTPEKVGVRAISFIWFN